MTVPPAIRHQGPDRGAWKLPAEPLHDLLWGVAEVVIDAAVVLHGLGEWIARASLHFTRRWP